ncbi:MAG: permease prefix domain 2-containing transporter, partial [Bacteroidota bacterium]
MADGFDNTPCPPWFFTRLLIWFCDAQLLEELQGDLEETYYYNHKTKGAFNARRLYIKEIIFLIRPSVVRKLNMNNYNNTMMIKNYAKVSFRNLLKYKLFSFINIFGLAVAMSVCLLIILMLADQHQYDGFHVQKDRIYRILTGHTDGNLTAATSPFSTAQYLDENYSISESTTTLRRGVGGDVVFEQNFSEMIGYFADPEFFNVFSYDLSKGNPATALINPNSMIISEEVSQKLFGNINPLGKIVEFTHRGLDFYSDDSGNPDGWGNYTITGVIPINQYKTHLKFDVLISSSSLNSLYQQEKVADVSEDWSNYYQTYNYVLLNPSSSEEDLSTALAEISKSKFSDLDDMKVSYLIPQSILDFRPGPLLNNTPSISLPLIIYYILGFMALIVLVLACLNYTNLSVARAITRSKEIGIRKVTGARRKDLLLQFLSESIITALLALVLANVILYFVKSAFMGLWVNKYLNFELTTNLY